MNSLQVNSLEFGKLKWQNYYCKIELVKDCFQSKQKTTNLWGHAWLVFGQTDKKKNSERLAEKKKGRKQEKSEEKKNWWGTL